MKKTTMKLRIKTGTFEAEGYRLPPIAGFGFLAPFAHRRLLPFLDDPQQSVNGEWNVSDLHTGCGMSPTYRTRREAVEGIAGYLADKGHKIVRHDFNIMLKRYGNLFANEEEKITKTENLNKGNDMKLTKTDDKFDGPAEVAKPKKTAKKDVTSPKLVKNLKMLDKKASKQITKQMSTGGAVSKGKKQCSRCKKILPLADFHKKTKSPDGKLGHCKVCECAYQKKRREIRPDIPGNPAGAAKKVVKKVVKKTTKKAAKKVARETTNRAKGRQNAEKN